MVLPSPGFNHGVLFLIPKRPSGLVSDTRPISVTNTDNRLLASTVAALIMPGVVDLVEPSQKGFLWGKSGADHTCAINEYFFEGVKTNTQRLCFFLDTAKAFDSIDHQWALHTLAKMGFPAWVTHFIESSLHDVKVSPCFGRSLTDWIDIKRGVKQGCPLSPLIFILAYDPLLFELAKIPGIGIFAFADDLALTAFTILIITPALIVISRFSFLSGLGINKDKSCVISSAPSSTHVFLRAELLNCPWPDLPLRGSATHLGIVVGREVTLADIFESPYKKAVDRIKSASTIIKRLPVLTRILYVNIFVVSLFSYHFLFFVLPQELYKSLKTLITKLVTPFNGGDYTYDTLVCLSLLFSIRPSLKDPWAVNVSLLAVRSPLLCSGTNYFSLPSISIVYSKFIRDHRNAAAVDFWRDRHLEDGTLTPLLKYTSPAVYQAVIEDVYLQEAVEHCSHKVGKFVLSNSPSDPPVNISSIESISTALSSSSRLCPPSFLFHHFSLIHNALATSRRMRHQNNLAVSAVPSCFFCSSSEDSLTHIYVDCVVVQRARLVFFQRLNFTTPPSCPPLLSTPLLTLSSTFLVNIAAPLVNPVLAFNYAVWKFRTPALGTRV